MSTDEIVNPASDIKNRRWQIFQFLGPILGVFLVIGTITLVTLHTYHTMREGAIMLSRNLLKSQKRYITQEVSNYLSPARSTSVIASDILNQDSPQENAHSFMSLARSVLKNIPQVDSFYLADDQGHFWMSSRRDGQYEETTLQNEDNLPYYRHNITDREGRFLSSDRLSAEGYDARVRPWFTGALRHEGRAPDDKLYWTDPYPYLSTHQFIVTASMAFHTLDGRRMVFAVNISLNQLTRFVNSLKVGESGQAVIVDLTSHVIAGHNMLAIDSPHFDATNVHLDPKLQPVFLRALNVFRVQGDGTGIVRARNQNYVTIASGMPLAKHSWVLLLNAPESDFASFTYVVQQQTIYFSLIIVGLASMLAVALIYQGRRVINYQQRLLLEEEEKKHDGVALLKIANTPGLLNSQQEVPYLTEVLAERSAARRVSIWRLLPDGERLLCEDMFDRERDVHGAGLELTKQAHEGLFSCLNEGRPLEISNAIADARVQSVQRVLLRKSGAAQLFLLPVFEQHKPVGLIMLEDSQDKTENERVAALVSSVVAVRFSQIQEKALHSSEEDVTENTLSPVERDKNTHIVEGFLVHPDQMGESSLPSVGLYAQVPLMVLEFSETYSSQKDTAQGVLELMTELSGKIETIARSSGLFSVQVAGNRFIFLGACSENPDPGGALRLADAAILIRDACLMVLSQMSTRLMFRIGLDVGATMVAHLGNKKDVFNLWGEALRVADILAHNAPDGGQIQVSEQAYQNLRRYFLFRPRGDFYLPSNGVTRSYILAGRR